MQMAILRIAEIPRRKGQFATSIFYVIVSKIGSDSDNKLPLIRPLYPTGYKDYEIGA